MRQQQLCPWSTAVLDLFQQCFHSWPAQTHHGAAVQQSCHCSQPLLSLRARVYRAFVNSHCQQHERSCRKENLPFKHSLNVTDHGHELPPYPAIPGSVPPPGLSCPQGQGEGAGMSRAQQYRHHTARGTHSLRGPAGILGRNSWLREGRGRQLWLPHP